MTSLWLGGRGGFSEFLRFLMYLVVWVPHADRWTKLEKDIFTSEHCDFHICLSDCMPAEGFFLLSIHVY